MMIQRWTSPLGRPWLVYLWQREADDEFQQAQ